MVRMGIVDGLSGAFQDFPKNSSVTAMANQKLRLFEALLVQFRELDADHT